MTVEILFPSDVYYHIMFREWDDALYLSEEPYLNNYLNERQNQIKSFEDRQNQLVEKATLIMKNLFSDTTFSIKLPNNGVLASEIYINYNFITTISVARIL